MFSDTFPSGLTAVHRLPRSVGRKRARTSPRRFKHACIFLLDPVQLLGYYCFVTQSLSHVQEEALNEFHVSSFHATPHSQLLFFFDKILSIIEVGFFWTIFQSLEVVAYAAHPMTTQTRTTSRRPYWARRAGVSCCWPRLPCLGGTRYWADEEGTQNRRRRTSELEQSRRWLQFQVFFVIVGLVVY